MSFGKRFTEVRKDKSLSQEEVAKHLGTKAPVIGRYERDEVKPSVEIATKIAEALEVSLDYLTGLSDIELDKNTVDIITSLQKLKNEDHQHIITTINALIRDAKARNTYA